MGKPLQRKEHPATQCQRVTAKGVRCGRLTTHSNLDCGQHVSSPTVMDWICPIPETENDPLKDVELSSSAISSLSPDEYKTLQEDSISLIDLFARPDIPEEILNLTKRSGIKKQDDDSVNFLIASNRNASERLLDDVALRTTTSYWGANNPNVKLAVLNALVQNPNTSDAILCYLLEEQLRALERPRAQHRFNHDLVLKILQQPQIQNTTLARVIEHTDNIHYHLIAIDHPRISLASTYDLLIQYYHSQDTDGSYIREKAQARLELYLSHPQTAGYVVGDIVHECIKSINNNNKVRQWLCDIARKRPDVYETAIQKIESYFKSSV